MYSIEFGFIGKKISDMTVGNFYQEIKNSDNNTPIAFRCLNNVNTLSEQQYDTFTISAAKRGARCDGLLTCATLIIVQVSQIGEKYKGEKCFVYHAQSGEVKQTILSIAKKSLGIVDFANCLVIYAHTKNKGEYNKEMKIFEGIISTDRLIEVYKVEASFGIQSDGMIGF